MTNNKIIWNFAALSLLYYSTLHCVLARPLHKDPAVSDLLTSLFRQTIYHRIENLLLDPGKKSTEKQQIIDSAVDNYHRQKMILPETDDGTTHYDITDLTGYWIRNPEPADIEIVEEPVLMASTQDGTFIAVHEPLVTTKVNNEENNNIINNNPDDDTSTTLEEEKEEEFSTESYRIEDLFADQDS